MSQKREEYHDPDYEQFQPVRSQAENVTKKSPETKSEVKSKPPETRIEAIRRIVDREFQKELNTKEQELEEINKRLDETKKLLAKVRYAVVHHYYNQKSLICSTEEIAAVEKSQQDAMTSYPLAGNKPQMAIHPSLKKLLGKRPIDYNEILKTRPARRAAQNATEQFHKMAKKPTDTKIKMAETILPNETEQYSENVSLKWNHENFNVKVHIEKMWLVMKKNIFLVENVFFLNSDYKKIESFFGNRNRFFGIFPIFLNLSVKKFASRHTFIQILLHFARMKQWLLSCLFLFFLRKSHVTSRQVHLRQRYHKSIRHADGTSIDIYLLLVSKPRFIQS